MQIVQKKVCRPDILSGHRSDRKEGRNDKQVQKMCQYVILKKHVFCKILYFLPPFAQPVQLGTDSAEKRFTSPTGAAMGRVGFVFDTYM